MTGVSLAHAAPLSVTPSSDPSRVQKPALVNSLKARVLAGLPVHFIDRMQGPAFDRHVEAVDKLHRELQRPVVVHYGPLED